MSILLLIPLIAMQFTNEVSWTIADFVVMGFLLLGTGLIIELILKKVKKPAFRIVFGITAVLSFLLVWAELAVGIFDSPIAGS